MRTIKKEQALLFAVLALMLYIALAPPVAWSFYQSMLFQPGHKPSSEESWQKVERDFGVSRKEISFFSSDGVLIHGWFFRLPGAKRVFLVSEGKGGSIANRSGMAKMLMHCGGSVLLYDYRGYGQSGGKPSLEGVCDDAIGAMIIWFNENMYGAIKLLPTESPLALE